MDEFDRIISSSLPEAEKLTRAFGWITERIIASARQEIELAQVMNDQEALVKTQVKLSTINHAREILQFCQQRIRAQEERKQ